MKTAIASLVPATPYTFIRAILLLLVLSMVGTACEYPPATETPVPSPLPTSPPSPVLTIITGGPCELAPGETTPLGVSGMPGTEVTYLWTASAGKVDPPDNAAVKYIAPQEPGEVIIRVVAQKGDVAGEAMITCQVVGPTAIPVDTETPTPTVTLTAPPTAWACTSTRTQKLQTATIPGNITINFPLQGATNVQSRQNIQVSGTHTGLPAGKYLWVFIYSPIAGLHGRYYPQTRDARQNWQPEPTTGQDGNWSVNVSFGAPNECYELIVILAEPAASKSIADQLKTWDDFDYYAGYELNGPVTAVPTAAPGLPDDLVEKASIEVKTR
jgi:hypothetical protein